MIIQTMLSYLATPLWTFLCKLSILMLTNLLPQHCIQYGLLTPDHYFTACQRCYHLIEACTRVYAHHFRPGSPSVFTNKWPTDGRVTHPHDNKACSQDRAGLQPCRHSSVI